MKTIKHPVQYDVVVAGGGVGGITAAVVFAALAALLCKPGDKR